MEYYLMNKDRELMLFRVTGDDMEQLACSEVETYVSPEELPPRFKNIDLWVDRRNYAKHKEHLHKWLKEWQIDNVEGFLSLTHALSLNDTLWVRPAGFTLQWEKVSLYRNEFTDVVSRTAFEKGLHGLQLSSTSPEFTSEGSFEKCWVKEGDQIFLYKKGSSGFANAGLEAYSEYYATQYAQALCREAVPYDLVRFKGSLVSRCEMFTSEEEGFVPIYKFLDPDKRYRFSDLLAFLEPFGFEEDFRNMVVLDAVIFNPDRHFGNFGFIVDNDTFQPLRFAPVFDHNMAMLARAMKDDLVLEGDYLEHQLGHKIGPDFIPAARELATEKARERLLALREEPLRLHPEFNLPKERTDFLERAVQHQIERIVA